MNTPFAVRKIGHAVIFVSDLERSKRFYTDVLGFKISDIYPGSMMPGGLVFLRCNSDHHCLALVGEGDVAKAKKLHHLAFELATLDEVFRARDHLKANGAAITSSSFGAWIKSAPTAARVRPRNGARRRASKTPCAWRRPARTRRCMTP